MEERVEDKVRGFVLQGNLPGTVAAPTLNLSHLLCFRKIGEILHLV
jgi:hypothetical protein